MSLLSIKQLSVTARQPIPSQSWWRSLGLRWQPRYRSLRILDQVSLDVFPDDFLVILGANGSGKTTLLRTITGLIASNLDAGEIFYQGRNVTRLPPHQRSIAFVSQHGGWYDHLTVQQNLSINRAQSAEVHRMAERLDLTALLDKYPNELSGGQTQRLALGRALLKDSPLILLDEPFNHLDPLSRESMYEQLRKLHQEGKTFVMVTHDQWDAMRMATKLAILNEGRIQQIGVANELYCQPNHRSVALALGQPAMQFFQFAIDAESWQQLWASNFLVQAHIFDSSDRPFVGCLRSMNDQPCSNVRAHLGIRPEGIRIIEPEQRDRTHGLCFEATLAEQHRLGSRRLGIWRSTLAESPSLSFRVATEASRFDHAIGTKRLLQVDQESIYFFDCVTGKCLNSTRLS